MIDFIPSRILAIETSCDETAAALIQEGRLILSNVVASQVDLHAKYGGVFPEAASREHIRTIHTVVKEALERAQLVIGEVDALAVTRGPGLAGSLVVGINLAKGLALATGRPLVGVNHLEGHLYSPWLHTGPQEKADPEFPLVALIVSGGHTELVLMEDHLQVRRLGGTLDDAAGEAFDKVARILGLGFPGGPAVQVAAEAGDPSAVRLPRAWLEGSDNFSFSGLKTAVLREVQKYEARREPAPVADLAASFQAAVVDVLAAKTLTAAETYRAKSVVVAGGVSANRRLRERLEADADRPVFIPPIFLCTDNAAMIGAAGYYHLAAGRSDSLDFDALPNWRFG